MLPFMLGIPVYLMHSLKRIEHPPEGFVTEAGLPLLSTEYSNIE
jgi:hypothetical protein